MRTKVAALLLGLSLGASVSYAGEDNNATTQNVVVTRGNVEIIKATENIRYLSQKVAKEYLYYFRYPENIRLKETLQTSLASLGKNIKVISTFASDAETNDVLDFLTYSKEEILALLKKKPSKEYAELMIDYSDTLLEGADLIADRHRYDFSREERMLVVAKNISYLLERALKYYIALYNGLNSQNIRKQLYATLEEIREYLGRFDAYPYPSDLQNTTAEMKTLWQRSEAHIAASKSYFLPNVLANAVAYLERDIERIVSYHTKKL